MTSQYNETETRYNLIDPQLIKAGWKMSDRRQIGFEVPVDGYDAAPVNGITDYCFFRDNGEVLAVIEAKKTKRDSRVGKEQVYQYVTKIEKKQSFRPFALMTNGEDIWFWDSDTTAERQISGFFSREVLERLLFLKQNRQPLGSVTIKNNIVERAYQVEAIRRISEVIGSGKKRKALLVMATGTGKTRTIMAMIDVFLRTKVAQRVLFLADRDTLVDQALEDGFKAYLPDESRGRIRTFLLDDPKEKTLLKGARLLVSTLQTLESCYERFNPGDFDLIIADECHRSIYNKYTDILAYFDAYQVGLTATPAHFIERNTFKFFECDGAVPTFLYTYDQAVKDGYLADYSVYAAQTKFQRKGIKGVDLTEEEKEILRERGIDPDTINFEGTDLERNVTNMDSLKRQWEEFMSVCHLDAAGQMPAKTIVFAITHQHAMRLEQAFNEMYREHKGLLARVIDSKIERAKDLLTQFKKEDLPRIAISVDMLDTGVDVPEVMNLAFMKPIGSQIKFMQMIGRGTRSHEACKQFGWLPGFKKETFLIVDFWENFEHFNMMPKGDNEQKGQVPVLVGIFNVRLSKLEALIHEPQSTDFKRIVTSIRKDIAGLPLDSFTVKKELKNIREVFEETFWLRLTKQKLEFLRLHVGPLLRFVSGLNLPELFFTSKAERTGLLLITGADQQAVNKSVEGLLEDIHALYANKNLSQVASQLPLLEKIVVENILAKPNLTLLDEVRDKLAPLMKYKREFRPEPFELGLDDIIDSRKWVVLRHGEQKIMVEQYRKQVEERIEKLVLEQPLIQKLKNKEPIQGQDLIKLEATLEAELGEALDLNEENVMKAFGLRIGSFTDFLKHILGLEHLPTQEEIVRKAFDAFILEHNYNAEQTKFLRTVQTFFIQQKKLELADLYEPPFTNFGLNAVEKLFDNSQLSEILELVTLLR